MFSTALFYCILFSNPMLVYEQRLNDYSSVKSAVLGLVRLDFYQPGCGCLCSDKMKSVFGGEQDTFCFVVMP